MTGTTRRYRIVSAAAAFLMWGGWAFYVNAGDGVTRQVVSAGIQGAISFTVTLLMVRALTALYRRLPASRARGVLPTAITVGCTGSCAALAHYLAGTPHIAKTLFPVLTMASLFGLYTTRKLARTAAAASSRGGCKSLRIS